MYLMNYWLARLVSISSWLTLALNEWNEENKESKHHWPWHWSLSGALIHTVITTVSEQLTYLYLGKPYCHSLMHHTLCPNVTSTTTWIAGLLTWAIVCRKRGCCSSFVTVFVLSLDACVTWPSLFIRLDPTGWSIYATDGPQWTTDNSTGWEMIMRGSLTTAVSCCLEGWGWSHMLQFLFLSYS